MDGPIVIPQRLPAIGRGRTKQIISVAALTVGLSACGSSKGATAPASSTRSPTTAPSATTTTTPVATTTTIPVGRAVTSTVTFLLGEIRLDPAGGAIPAITAKAAFDESRRHALSDLSMLGSPQLLLGILSVSDAGFASYHRLVWLVVSQSRAVDAHCPRGHTCVPTTGTNVDAVDAKTGMYLNGWWASGE
jgi:hypothetical protein